MRNLDYLKKVIIQNLGECQIEFEVNCDKELIEAILSILDELELAWISRRKINPSEDCKRDNTMLLGVTIGGDVYFKSKEDYTTDVIFFTYKELWDILTKDKSSKVINASYVNDVNSFKKVIENNLGNTQMEFGVEWDRTLTKEVLKVLDDLGLYWMGGKRVNYNDDVTRYNMARLGIGEDKRVYYGSRSTTLTGLTFSNEVLHNIFDDMEVKKDNMLSKCKLYKGKELKCFKNLRDDVVEIDVLSPYVVATFDDGKKTIAYCCEEDIFDAQVGVDVCMTKRIIEIHEEELVELEGYLDIINNNMKSLKDEISKCKNKIKGL